VPAWIHERAKHLLAKNPSMSKSTAFGVATQQSHAKGKTPKGYGTTAGKTIAKAKYDEPKAYTSVANPENLKTRKLSDKPTTRWTGSHLVKASMASFVAEVTKLADLESTAPVLGGLALGYGPGRNVAGSTAKVLSPHGRKVQGENIARDIAMVAGPASGVAALALAKKYNLGTRLAQTLSKRFPKGVIASPETEKEIVEGLIPMGTAITGGMAGGAASGGTVGAVQKLRGPAKIKEVDRPDIYERLVEGQG
jgi:hypothetical protein